MLTLTKTKPTSFAVRFGVISAAMFMANLDAWVVNVALPTIGTDFGQRSLAHLSWVLNSYVIVLGALLVVAGRLGDRIGNRRLFLSGIALFTVASAVCAAAPDFPILILARTVQAAGAAAQLPASLALLMATVPAERRQTVGRLWAAVGGMAGVLGPVIGGILVEASWRWIFLINIPIGVLTLILGARVLPQLPAKSNEPRPDLLAAALLTMCIAALTGALVQVGPWGWTNHEVLAMFAVAVLAGLVFGVRCKTHSAPLIEGHLVRNRLFVVSNLASLVFNVGFAVFPLSITLWCQTVWHYSPLKTGLALAPGPMMVPIVAALCIPLLRRCSTRLVCVTGALIYSAGTVWVAFTESLQPGYASEVLPAFLLAGIGFAMTATTLMGTAAAALPPGRAATGSAVVNAGRQLATNFGVAILVTVIGTQPAMSRAGHLFRTSWLIGGGLALAAAIICWWLPQNAD